METGRVPRGGAAAILKDLSISGEIGLKPLANGKWLLEICSETDLDEARLKVLGTVRGMAAASE